jgi:predicted homoserine dehydrogenase-like protein
MGDGPFYLLYKPNHLCFFETPNTLLNLLHKKEILMDNGVCPTVSVGAIAKKKLTAGSILDKAIGSMEVRGEVVDILAEPSHVPIGLMTGARLRRNVEPGHLITYDDVDIPDSLAYTAWKEIVRGCSAGSNTADKKINLP